MLVAEGRGRCVEVLAERGGEPGFGGFGTVFSHGGHSNLVQNCVFVECRRPLGSSPWNQARWVDFLKSPLIQTHLLEEVSVTGLVWRTHYPALAGIFAPEDDAPRPRVRTLADQRDGCRLRVGSGLRGRRREELRPAPRRRALQAASLLQAHSLREDRPRHQAVRGGRVGGGRAGARLLSKVSQGCPVRCVRATRRAERAGRATSPPSAP